MSVRTFLRAFAVLLFALAVWGVKLLIHQWHEQTIAGLKVRQNAITGIVQLDTGSGWATPFHPDPYAPAVAPADLARIRLLDPTWGRNGLLVARAVVAPGLPIRGRLIVTLNIVDVANGQIGEKVIGTHIRERDFRENVDWPAGALTPFVLRTNLSAPVGVNQRTRLGIAASLASGGDADAGG